MKQIIKLIKSQYTAHRAFVWYGSLSVMATVIDIILCRYAEMFFGAITANTIGIVGGFIFHYLMSSKHVYNNESIYAFVIYIATFFLGLVLANGIVYFLRMIYFQGSDSIWAFSVSKGFSVIVPFFIMYFIRKKFIKSNGK